jgi:hypothetical protein
LRGDDGRAAGLWEFDSDEGCYASFLSCVDAALVGMKRMRRT